MDAFLHRHWQTPNRQSGRQAKLMIGLSIFILLLAASGLVLYDGWARVVHVSALALVGLANLALAIGSVIPDARGGKLLRDAVVPLALLMFVALFASIAMHLASGEQATLVVGVTAAIGGLAGWWQVRRRQNSAS